MGRQAIMTVAGSSLASVMQDLSCAASSGDRRTCISCVDLLRAGASTPPEASRRNANPFRARCARLDVQRALVLLALLLLPGCFRLGAGEDLHLVCEEKATSPRKAYGIDFLVARTRADEGVPPEFKVAMLEAARAHVVTPRGREHASFEADLVSVNASTWRFDATGLWDDAPADQYRVLLRAEGETLIAGAQPPNPGPAEATRTLVDVARAAANVTTSFDARNASLSWAAWDPELPSCVRLRLDTHDVVVNVVQLRVVLIVDDAGKA